MVDAERGGIGASLEGSNRQKMNQPSMQWRNLSAGAWRDRNRSDTPRSSDRAGIRQGRDIP
jgi:hypothetical protein